MTYQTTARFPGVQSCPVNQCASGACVLASMTLATWWVDQLMKLVFKYFFWHFMIFDFVSYVGIWFVFNRGIIHLIRQERVVFVVYIQTCYCFSFQYICRRFQMDKKVETIYSSILLMFYVYGRVHIVRQKQKPRNLKAYQNFKLECTERQTLSRLAALP